MVEKIKIMSHSCHKERKRICLDVCFKKITTAERFISVQTNIHLIVYLLYQSWTLLGFEGKQQKEKKTENGKFGTENLPVDIWVFTYFSKLLHTKYC